MIRHGRSRNYLSDLIRSYNWRYFSNIFRKVTYGSTTCQCQDSGQLLKRPEVENNFLSNCLKYVIVTHEKIIQYLRYFYTHTNFLNTLYLPNLNPAIKLFCSLVNFYVLLSSFLIHGSNNGVKVWLGIFHGTRFKFWMYCASCSLIINDIFAHY